MQWTIKPFLYSVKFSTSLFTLHCIKSLLEDHAFCFMKYAIWYHEKHVQRAKKLSSLLRIHLDKWNNHRITTYFSSIGLPFLGHFFAIHCNWMAIIYELLFTASSRIHENSFKWFYFHYANTKLFLDFYVTVINSKSKV